MLAARLSSGYRRAFARGDQGAAAVEFALVLPILVMLVLGIITAGLSYSQAIGLTNAVREGARFGATADATDGGDWIGDTVARVRATQFDDPSNLATVCAQLWRKGADTNPVTADCSPGAAPLTALDTTSVPDVFSTLPDGACVVRVMGARNFTINLGLASWERVHVSSSIARYERMDLVSSCT